VEVGAQVWYVARLALLVLMVAIAIVSVTVQTRRRRFAGLVRVIAAGVLAVLGAVLAVLSAVRPNALWVAIALVAGAVLGVALGRLSEPAARGGRPSVKRVPVAQLFAAAGYVVLATLVLFGTPMLAALAMIWVVMAFGMLAGAEVGEYTVAPRPAAPGPVGAP
jgi:hypothetical protein